MSDLIPYVASAAPAVQVDHVAYNAIVADLENAAAGMRLLVDLVAHTMAAVDDCATGTDQLAETASTLDVDPDTVGEHHQAAQLMRAAVSAGADVATRCEELAGAFRRASAAHQADYADVVEAARALPVAMADRSFYANR